MDDETDNVCCDNGAGAEGFEEEELKLDVSGAEVSRDALRPLSPTKSPTDDDDS